MTLPVGQVVRIVREPSRSTNRERFTFKVGIVIGPSRRAGKVRVCFYRRWNSPVVIAEARLQSIDIYELPLTEAKRLRAATFERDYLLRVMERAKDSVAVAARLTGIDRTNFRRLLQMHGLRGNFKAVSSSKAKSR